VLKIDSTERYNYASKRRFKNYRLIYQNEQDAGPELQPASVGLPDWRQAQEDSNEPVLWLLCYEK
jgi:hypothetical protein